MMQLHRFRFTPTLLAVWLTSGAAVGLLHPRPAAAANAARIVLAPAGATLQPGQSFQFQPIAYNRAGNPLPGVTFTYQSNKTAVVRVARDGTATAGNSEGAAVVTVRGGGKRATATVNVVRVAQGARPPVAVGLDVVNGVLVDGDAVYWTEVGKKLVRVRKSSRTGGPIFDLASEPVKDDRSLRVRYAHLRLSGDLLFFSRQTVGLFDHWSIRSISLTNGAIKQHLKEDASVTPLLAAGWQIVGRHLLVAVITPSVLRLPASTRIAALDLDTGEWSAAITGVFREQRALLLAADGQFAYVRGRLVDGRTQVARFDPAIGGSSLTPLWTTDADEQDLSQAGAVDDSNVYFWSSRDAATHRLLSVPVGGGEPNVIASGKLGLGLVSDGVNLYYARSGTTIFRQPVGGGPAQEVASGLYAISTLGGLALDAESLFPVRKVRAKYAIFRVNR